MPEKQEKALTIFDAGEEEREEAIKNLLKGKTPSKEIKRRKGRAGDEYSYVGTYYMTRQIALITGFRWKSQCLEERFLPNNENPREVGARMKVTIWDSQEREYSHESWGQKDIAYTKDTHKPLSIFDDLKAAYSDGIKKCLSYFGIASDIYGGKELEYFSEDNVEADMSSNEAYKAFARFLSSKKISVSEACKRLGVERLADITDYKTAHDKLLEGGDAKQAGQLNSNK